MKKIFLAITFLAGLVATLSATSFEVDTSHSSINFDIRHLSLSNVKGSFGEFSGEIEVNNKKITTLKGIANIASIDTNNKERDNHLQATDYFDAAKFNTATLEMKKLVGNKLHAELTIKGIKKNVVFDVSLVGPVKHPKIDGKEAIGVTLKGSLNRKDFDIAKNTPNAALGEKVNINIELEAISK